MIMVGTIVSKKMWSPFSFIISVNTVKFFSQKAIHISPYPQNSWDVQHLCMFQCTELN